LPTMAAPRVLLTTLNAKYIHMNLAIRLLYELNQSYENLSWQEFTIKDNPEHIVSECLPYDVVCFSCYIWNITQTLRVTEKLREQNPGVKILLGGPEVSYEWEEIIVRSDIDYIIIGEGEIPFQLFLQHYPKVDHIANLVSKQGSSILYHTDKQNFDLTLYQGTNPYQHDDQETLRNRVLYMETSRGCPYKCEFCLASLDNKVRYLPMEHIESNLLYLMQHGKVIKFLDRTFNVKKDFTLHIFQFILDHARPENVFQFEITADILHPDIMTFIKERIPKGMFRFEIGIQTVNQKANLEVSRKQNFEKTKGVILELKDYVEMHLDLIVGLPLDYWDDIKYSFEQVFALFPPELQLGFLKFLKGTPVREKYEQYGFEFDPVAPYQIIRSNYLSESELNLITQLEHALEIYWNKKRLVQTLRYVLPRYSIFDFLLGLGIQFGKQSDYFRHTLNDVYDIATEWVKAEFATDNLLPEFIALDYYLQYKIRPAERFIPEIPRKIKMAWAQTLRLPLNKLRYSMVPFSFDVQHFLDTGEVLSQDVIVAFEYTGISKPRITGQWQRDEILISSMV
jgi:anaerobic magnesium-protoporphyrin IX monomethyl ester cyclase